MQFRAQHADYQTNYPEADWLVTMRGGEDIGRLYIERWPSQHCIIDIAFLPEHRGKGLGEALLRDLMDEAKPPARRCRSMSRNSTRRCGSTGASDSRPRKTRASTT